MPMVTVLPSGVSTVQVPWLRILRTRGSEVAYSGRPAFSCVPLSITPEKGCVPDRSQVPHRNLGWVISPEPLRVPRL